MNQNEASTACNESALAKLTSSMKGNQTSHSLKYPAIGMLAIASVSQAYAGIIYNDNGFTVGNRDSVDWDINGDSSADMTLFDDTVNICGSSPSVNEFFVLESSGAGAGFMYQSGDQLVPISNSSVVGPAGVFTRMDCATHDNPCASLGSTSEDFDLFTGADSGNDFDGLIGFMFDNMGTTNYGIAAFSLTSLDGTLPLGQFTINRWWYDDSGAEISGLSAVYVPEPAITGLMLSGLVGLAMGFSGSGRRKKKLS